MSENLELVRSIYAAWERGDYTSTGWAHPEIEFGAADGPMPGISSGLARMAEATRWYVEAWDDVRFVADEYRDIDDERVLVLAQFFGRGKTSGLDLAQVKPQTAHVFHVREGKVVKLVTYWDRERAFADLGLEA